MQKVQKVQKVIPLMRMASAERVGAVGLRADSTSRRKDCAINACKLRENDINEYNRQIGKGKNYIIPLKQLQAKRDHKENCGSDYWNPVYDESCDQEGKAIQEQDAEDEQKTGGKKKRKHHTRKHKKSNRKSNRKSKHHKKSHKGGNKKSNRKTHKRTKHHKKRGHKSRRRR